METVLTLIILRIKFKELKCQLTIYYKKEAQGRETAKPT